MNTNEINVNFRELKSNRKKRVSNSLSLILVSEMVGEIFTIFSAVRRKIPLMKNRNCCSKLWGCSFSFEIDDIIFFKSQNVVNFSM